MLFISLDNFTLVNDSLGHTAGDELLRQFANRLRDAAFGAELVARHGGDEFLVLVADTGEHEGDGTHAVPEDVAQMAEALVGRLQHLLAIPFSYDGGDVYLSASAGVALYPRDAGDRDSLIKRAPHRPLPVAARPPAARGGGGAAARPTSWRSPRGCTARSSGASSRSTTSRSSSSRRHGRSESRR